VGPRAHLIIRRTETLAEIPLRFYPFHRGACGRRSLAGRLGLAGVVCCTVRARAPRSVFDERTWLGHMAWAHGLGQAAAVAAAMPSTHPRCNHASQLTLSTDTLN
jgi:hypothetical protein